ncbi:hypothetical protein ACLX1H_007464 [Fusarium chlamydosporum]
MFSTIIGHTRGLFPQRESKEGGVAGIGDFDHTPPHSGRSSADIPRKERDAASQQLLDKSSLVDLTNAIKDCTTAPIIPSQVHKVDYFSGNTEDSPCPGHDRHLASVSPGSQEKVSACAESSTQLPGVEIEEAHMSKLHGRDDLCNSVAQLCSPASARESSTAYAYQQGRSRSLGSIMDILWKSDWLKRLSRIRGSYDPVLTDLPPRTRSGRADDRRPSEPVLPSSQALRERSIWSTFSGKSDPYADGTILTHTFRDFERLVDEALSLAPEVADHSEAAARDQYNTPPASNGPDLMTESDISHDAQDVTVLSVSGDDQYDRERPQYRRAATYTAVPKRPRLADIVESYSGTYQELRARTHIGRTHQEGFSQRTSHSSLSRQSSQTTKAEPKRSSVALQDLLSTATLLKPNAEGKVAQGAVTTIQRRTSVMNASPAIGSGTGQDALPQHDIAGRRLHYEHGVNLRKRSHVSLRDTAGFNLPKSHVRHPIARDWSPVRKRFVASVACLSTALIGVLLGIYTGLVPSIQYYIVDQSHVAVHGNTEVVDQFDARRHGGGMGIWLGIWTWCWIGSLGVGFLIGAAIIDRHPPAWGFYVSIVMIAVVLILNVICPEVRRSAFRRSIAEVRTGGNISRRLARGEVMMHRVKTGPKWWGQEAYHGIRLSLEMLEQPGFTVMAIYVSWIYAQIVLVIILMGSLVSRFYRLRSPYVGLHVAAVAVGALLAIPFQKASIFSRSRRREGRINRDTIGKKVVWSSHLIRRAIFTISLPIGAACYAAVSSGPPISSGVPAFFALCIGFLSCLAISECNGLIMETFDTSDLSPGMVGRHRDPSGQDQRRTNYSSFPRVTAGFAIIHSLSYILAAGSTALGGHVTRKLGQQVATSVVAGILFMLTVLLLLVLIRFKNVLIIPRSKSEEMEKLTQARRQSSKRRATMPNDMRALMEEDHAWRPAMTGNPMGKNRRMNVLEMGNLTRWQDIRRRNKLIDAGVHINRDTLDHGLDAVDVALESHVDDMRQNAQGFFRRGTLRKHGSHSRRSNQSRSSDQTFHDLELDMLDPTETPGESSQQRQHFSERDCVMGQTIEEDARNENQAGPSNSQ